MSSDSIYAVQRLNDYLEPSQRRYFKTKADLFGYYEDRNFCLDMKESRIIS